MAIWQTVMTLMLRHLINDLSATQEFTDNRLQESLVVAGIIVSQQYTFDTSYTFDIEAPDISPDPVTRDDKAAIALITLKAACIIQTNRYQDAVGSSIRVKDGDSEIDTTTGFGGHKDLLTLGPCKAYDDILEDLMLEESALRGGIGKAVVTPYSHIDLTSGGSHHLGAFGRRDTVDFFNSLLRFRG